MSTVKPPPSGELVIEKLFIISPKTSIKAGIETPEAKLRKVANATKPISFDVSNEY